jgi:hypothetical protein
MFLLDTRRTRESKQEAAMNTTMRLSTSLQIQGITLADASVRLLPGQVVSMDRSKGRRLACTAGTLWVTLEHDAGDYILEADQSLEIREDGHVVISALEPGAFLVA